MDRRTALSAAIILATLCTPAAGQRRKSEPQGHQTGPDYIGFRLEEKIKSDVSDVSAAQRPTTQQAMEDFLRIQQISRLLLDMTRGSRPVALDLVAKAAADVNKRAQRLKSNLGLPKPPKSSDKSETPESPSPNLVKDQIEQLEESVKALVSNPMFQNIKAADRDLAKEASADLQKIIAKSRLLQQVAEQVGAAGGSQQAESVNKQL
jgi:hypothetical protein